MYSLTFVFLAFSVGWLIGILLCFVILTIGDKPKGILTNEQWLTAEDWKTYHNLMLGTFANKDNDNA